MTKTLTNSGRVDMIKTLSLYLINDYEYIAAPNLTRAEEIFSGRLKLHKRKIETVKVITSTLFVDDIHVGTITGTGIHAGSINNYKMD